MLPPPLGVGNSDDTFTYTARDNGGAEGTGEVTIHVAARIWWVDNTAAGNGASWDAFGTLSAAQLASDPGGSLG